MMISLLLILGWVAVSLVVATVFAALFSGAARIERRELSPRTYELVPTGAIPGQRSPMRTSERV
jgi:hypothetical protein